MTCLNDIQIQALADGEGNSEMTRHASGCAACAGRLRERERTMAAIRQAIDVPVRVPARLAQRVDQDFRLKAKPRNTKRGGHGIPGRRRWSHRARACSTLAASHSASWLPPSGGRKEPLDLQRPPAVAAATLVVLVPSDGNGETVVITVWPSHEVFDAWIATPDRDRLTASDTHQSVDYHPVTRYEEQVDGTYKIRQAIDYKGPGRFRFASYTAGGQMLTSIAQDPIRKRRWRSRPRGSRTAST
jgi:hypothetical protein